MSEPECGDHLIGSSKPGLSGGAEAELGSIHQHQTLFNTGGLEWTARPRAAAEGPGCEAREAERGFSLWPRSYCSHTGIQLLSSGALGARRDAVTVNMCVSEGKVRGVNRAMKDTGHKGAVPFKIHVKRRDSARGAAAHQRAAEVRHEFSEAAWFNVIAQPHFFVSSVHLFIYQRRPAPPTLCPSFIAQ